MISSRRFGFFLALPMVVAVSLSACSDEGDEVEGTGGSGNKAGSAGKGGSDSKAGSSNNGGKAGDSTAGKTNTGGDEPTAGTNNTSGSTTGGTESTGGTGGTDPTGEAGMAGETGMAGDGGTTATGGTGGSATGGTASGGGGTGGTASGGGGMGGGGTSSGGGGTGGGGTSSGGGGTDAGGGGTGGTSTGGGGTDAGGGGTGGSGGSGGGCPAPTHTTLRDFATDPGGGLDKYLTPNSGTLATSTVGFDAVEGNPAAGSAKLVAKFSGTFGEKAQVSNYGPPFNLTCKTKVHAMVKLVAATDLTHIKQLSFSMNSDGYAVYTALGINTASFVSGTWYQIDLDLASPYLYTSPSPPVLAKVNNIAVQIETVTSGTTPVETTMYLDDIWAE